MSNDLSSGGHDRSLYRWRFFRAGGVDQVAIRNGADVLNLAALDQKLWVALACPTVGVELDPKTLKLLDTDGDGRIRVPEVLAAIQWASQVFTNLDGLLHASDNLPLSALNAKTELGATVLAGAKRILLNLGKAEATSISLADVADTSRIFAATKLNGDGIVPADSAADDATKNAIEDIIATQGAVTDRSGKPGVDQARVDALFSQAGALLQWHALTESDSTLLPLGGATATASAAAQALMPKINDYFVRCRLAAFDSRTAGLLNRSEADLLNLASQQLTARAEEIAKLPLARVEAGRPLPLTDGINPAWTEQVAAFVANTVTPLLGNGRTSLTESEWAFIQAKLAPYETWMAKKPVTAVEKLGLIRLRTLHSSDLRQRITDLIQQDAALAGENAQIGSVEKAILLFRDLFKFLNNFASFSEFYSGKSAIFQVGTLYLDGRSCKLCVRVCDAGKHAALAGLSAAYLAYCDCSRPNGEKMTIVAAFTNGDSDRLMVGRNGVFYDRKGRDWDASITKIVANPISIREAFWTPYKKFVRTIEEQVAKRAGAAEARSQGIMASTAETIVTTDKPAAGAKPVQPKPIDVGTVAAIGVALGAIGAMFAGILGAFFGLGAWMPFGLLALILMISGPSMLLAYLKLRQRNLGPILDANGWAINGRARINVPFGAALTSIATLPPGAERSLDDAYAEKKRPWRVYFGLGVLILGGLAWYFGKLDNYLPGAAKSTSALGTNAPAFKRPVISVETPKPPADNP